MCAQQYNLDNLTVIVDRNEIQQGDFTENTIRMEPLADRWEAFGFAVKELDGHDHLGSSRRSVPYRLKGGSRRALLRRRSKARVSPLLKAGGMASRCTDR